MTCTRSRETAVFYVSSKKSTILFETFINAISVSLVGYFYSSPTSSAIFTAVIQTRQVAET
jgi:hypothetical protein